MNKTPKHADQDLLYQVLGTVALVVLAFVETALGQFPLFYGSAPMIMVMVIWGGVLYLPIAVPPVAIILAGFVFDLSQGVPLGFTPSLLLLGVMMLNYRRPFLIHADAGTIWYEFTALAAVLQIYSYIVVMLFSGGIPAFGPFIFQFGMTVFLFPIVHWATTLLKHFDRGEQTG